jgi:hypothetical protein
MWYIVNKFGFARIFSKCNVKEQVLRDCTFKNLEW